MGSLEDFYRQKQSSDEARQDAIHIQQYNRWVDIVSEATRSMVHQAHSHPPKNCAWVIENGKQVVSWELFREYDDSYRFNLMPDGRLVRVHGTYNSDLRPDHVSCSITLRHISTVAEEQQRDINWSDLAELTMNIVRWGLDSFGLPSPPHFHRDLLPHWNQTLNKSDAPPSTGWGISYTRYM